MSLGEPRYFTREEAEALLPRISEILLRAQGLVDELREAQAGKEHSDRARRNGHAPVVSDSGEARGAANPVVEQIQQLIDQIRSMGVILRDVRTGLVDFPAILNGTEIFLCWKLGEPPRIDWWHPTTTGIAGRRRISESPG